MAVITNPALLTEGVELILTATTNPKTIALKVDGNLTTEGVSGWCLFTKLKSLWRTNANYPKYLFPMKSSTMKQFEFINGWVPADEATRKLIRNAGWAERNAAGALQRIYAGIVSYGSLGATDLPYVSQAVGGSNITNMTYPGAVNEAVQVYGATGQGGFDYRNYLTVYTREQGKNYTSVDVVGMAGGVLSNEVYSIGLSTTTDPKVSHTDAQIATVGGDYNGITVTCYATDQMKTIGGTAYPFRTIISGDGQTVERIYEKIQYLLRQNADIDSGTGTLTGKVASPLLSFTVNTLTTAPGVYIENYAATDSNRIEFYDKDGVKRVPPYVASGFLQFNSALVNDPTAKYFVFFQTLPGSTDDFGEANAVLVQDASGNAITGNVGGAVSIAFTFDYDVNVQGGRTPGTDAAIVVVALGETSAAYVNVNATLTRAAGQSIMVSAPLDPTAL